ncbi:MAG: hypothetical protein IJ455_01885 [Agathobacter sp.]|nr:hypothetical protein [Agathobacter sp.]
MGKMPAEDYLDKLLNSVNDEKARKEKFKETAKMLDDAMSFWESKGTYLDFEELPERQQAVREERKSEQENILDALLSSAQNTEFGMNKRKPDSNPMYSRRVSKSEADFLKEFEAELAGGEDDFADLFASFETEESLESKIEPEDRLETEDIHAAHEVYEDSEEDSFMLGDMDLASLVNEAAGVMAEASEETAPEPPVSEEVPMDVVSMDEIPVDVFEDLFGGEDGLDLAESVPMQNESEGIDLGNLGEDDLMSLLAGTDDLADIGNMLSQSEATEIPLEEMDAFTVFAENEMSAQQISAEPATADSGEKNKGKKDKKGGLIGKLKAILGSLMKDDEEDEVELKPAKNPTAEALAGENADILAELDALEEKPSKKGKKKKEKKEKKPKKEKAPKKPKAPKAPKPKKEKKPKVVDNTPPLPKGPVFMIWLMAASLVALVILGVNLLKYNTPIANAKNLQNQGHYAEAFAELSGLEIKEKDMELYNRLAVLSTVDSELDAYAAFEKAEIKDKAFDSLICAAGRCYINEDNADVYGCLGQLETLKRTVSNELEQKYNMTYEEAIEMYTIRDRDDYTIALYKKLTELGIDWE